MFDSMGITSNDSTWLDAAEQHLTRELAGDHTVAVVVDAPSGGLAGCGVIEIHQRIPSPSNPRGRIGYLSTVSTDPAWQRRGIATTVLARLIAEAEHRAIPRIELHATPDGIDLYRASGFVDRRGGREMRRDTGPIHLSRL
jgi:ribosomal protein S18 acetylase RimI-like enzyme